MTTITFNYLTNSCFVQFPSGKTMEVEIWRGEVLSNTLGDEYLKGDPETHFQINYVYPDYISRLHNYYRPGKIVPSYFGRDKVIMFQHPLADCSNWYVTVQEVDKKGNPIGANRNHSTNPIEPF